MKKMLRYGMSGMYPNIELTLEFADEDLGQNCGEMKFKGGDIIEEYIPHTGKEDLPEECDAGGRLPQPLRHRQRKQLLLGDRCNRSAIRRT